MQNGNDPLDAAWEQANGKKKSVGTSGDPLDAAFDSSAPDTSIHARDILRSFTQGATFGFGDELGITDKGKADAFKKAHPVVDFVSKLGGGMIAPVAATLAAPEALAGLGGAALLGGAAGGLTGAGEAEGGMSDRLKGAAVGGVMGAGGGAAGYGASKLVGGAMSALMDRINPTRAVARAASKLVEPADIQRMADINKMAPGTASLATSTTPTKVNGVPSNSRFLSMTRAVAASPKAGAQAERDLLGQHAAIETAKDAIGSKMDALEGRLPIDDEIRGAMRKVKDVLGGKAPSMPEAADANPLGIEKSTPFSFDEQVKDLSVADARAALSRLRYLSRNAAKRGTEQNGATTYEINDAKNALQRALYKRIGGFRDLDAQYGTMMDQQRQVNKLLSTARLSRQNYAGNEAYKATSGSLGGSLPAGRHGVAMHLIDKMLTDKAGSADAVGRYVLKAGDAKVVQDLLKFSRPASPRVQATINGASAAVIPGMRGLLFGADDMEQ